MPLRPDEELPAWAAELFSSLGPVSVRRMFGGHGFFLEGLMFALEAEGDLYLKVNPSTQAAFKAAGGRPFSYGNKQGRTTTLAYWTPPEAALENPREMAPWARMAFDAALRARAEKPLTSQRRTKNRGFAEA